MARPLHSCPRRCAAAAPRPPKLPRAVAPPAGITHSSDVHSILTAVAHGRVDVHDAAQSIEELSSGLTALQPSKPQTRILDAPGMPAAQLAHTLEDVALEQHTAAARRVSPDLYASVRNVLPGVQYHAGAEMLLFTDAGAAVPKPPRLPGRVAIVCGSSTDLQGAYEAKVVVGLMGGYATIHQGVSAAELTSVVRARAAIEGADAVIVCCGEQPALAGLVAGMVAVPVIALPGHESADPTRAVAVAGVAKVAPGDGASAAVAASRTLRVAAQYIQYRKDREEKPPAEQEDLPPQPLPDSSDDAASQPSKPVVFSNIVPARPH